MARTLALTLLSAGLATAAHAQPASAPAAPPAAPPAAKPAAAPIPDFPMIAVGLTRAACEKEAKCGCSKGVDACVAMLADAGVKPPTLACIAHQPCPVICESEDAGQPGTKLHAACLTPEATVTAATHFKQNAVVAMCAAARRCGCEKRTPAECAPSVIADAPDVSGAFFACVSQQPCEELCHPNPTRPGGGIQTRCMQPALEASSAVRALRTTQLMLQLNLQMQQRMHETTMGIIRNMAPSPARVDVYDAQGNYLRSE